ncbi:WXG100 family type VII secretion target [Corynebacterium sp. H113]|uniref:WXG100 family type VII secretion target n=1 Tax=Corynebacterium sp. H113 TaxID=3133419 RepID=UPI0030A02FA4
MDGSGILSAETSQMNATAADVDAVNEEVGGQLARLRGIAEDLGADWRGKAKASFDDLMVRWDAAASNLSTALSDIANNIRDNSRGFDEGEAAGAETMNRIAAQGGGMLNL